MRPSARTMTKISKESLKTKQNKPKHPFWASCAARVNHLDVVKILEFGMISREVVDSDVGRLGEGCTGHLKQHSLKSARAISSQYFTCKRDGEEGREEAPCCFKAGKEANRSTILWT